MDKNIKKYHYFNNIHFIIMGLISIFLGILLKERLFFSIGIGFSFGYIIGTLLNISFGEIEINEIEINETMIILKSRKRQFEFFINDNKIFNAKIFNNHIALYTNDIIWKIKLTKNNYEKVEEIFLKNDNKKVFEYLEKMKSSINNWKNQL